MDVKCPGWPTKRTALSKIPIVPHWGALHQTISAEGRPSLWGGLQHAAWSLPSTFLVEHLLQPGLMTEVSNGVSVSQNMDRTVYCSSSFLGDMEQGQLLRRASLGNPDEARVGEQSVAALLQHGSGPIFSSWPFFSFLSFSQYCIIHMFLGPT